jgi:phospholipid transport system substrate-binding protein
MKRTFLGAVAALLCLTQTAQADPASAKAYIDGVAKQVLAIVKTDADKAAKTKKMESLFADKVDINFVAKFALGKHWRTATEAQRNAYVAAYKPFILKNYASRLARYSGQTYEMKQARADGGSSIVTMEIQDPNGQNVVVDYRVSGSNRITDIVVEGVSLLATQRSEFNSIVSQKGMDGLIDALKSQVAG